MALPPATSGIFSFAGDSLFVESSGKNLHRRSTIPELKAHFDASADRPAHWYEAQLIHYGLPSSRVKGTAKMRLYDAVKGKGLVVPGHMKTMETDLKKLWKKQGKGGQAGVNPAPPVAPSTNKRKANAAGEAPAAKAPKKNATSTPRKTTASKTSTAPSTNATSQAAHPTTTPTAQSKPKQTARRGGKAPQARAPAAVPVPEVETPAAPPRAKQTARRAGSAAAAAPRAKQTARRGGAATAAAGVADIPSVTVAPEQPPPAPRAKQTARRGGSAASRRGGSAGAAAVQEPFVPPGEKPKKAPRTKQTARCTGRGGAVGSRVTEAPPASVTPERKPQMARRGGHYPDYPAPRRGPPGYSDGTTEMYPWFNEPSSPDKKSESPCSPGPFAYDDINGDAMDEDEMDEDEMDQDDVDHDEMNDVGPAARLGLINGRYEVYEEPRDETSPPDTLILTLDGHSIWGYYEMQNLKGMFYMHGRPYTPDEGNRATHCRSRVANGAQLRFYDYRAFAPCQYLNLLGGGWLRGAVRHGYGHHDYRQFTAKRVSGGETRSEISPLEMRRRWEEFIPRDLVNSLGRQQPENRNRGW